MTNSEVYPIKSPRSFLSETERQCGNSSSAQRSYTCRPTGRWQREDRLKTEGHRRTKQSSGSKRVWCVLARVLPPLLWSARRRTPWWAQPVGWRRNSHLQATAGSWRWVRGSFHLECSSAAVSNREERRWRERQTWDTFTGWRKKEGDGDQQSKSHRG